MSTEARGVGRVFVGKGDPTPVEMIPGIFRKTMSTTAGMMLSTMIATIT